MKKTILLAAMFATVASFADGNYVKFSAKADKSFDTSYVRAEADDDANSISKGQALKATEDGSKAAAKKDADAGANKSVKFNDDANLEFGPEIQLTLGDSGFSFGGKLMNKTTFNKFDLSRLTLADGKSEAWGMFVLPKETVKDLSASVKFAIKTSKDVKNPELGLYNGDTKLDAKSDTDAPVILTKIDADSKDDVKYMTFGTENPETPVDFKSDNPKTVTSENSKLVANSYKKYMDDKSESVKTEGALDTTLDYALETKELKSANIGLNTSTSFEFKKDTDFTTKYTAYADLKGEVNAFRTELETANNYKDSRFKGFKYIQSMSDLKLGITDISGLAYLSLNKLDDSLTAYEDSAKIEDSQITPDKKKEILKKYIGKLEDSYLEAKKKDAKDVKEAYDKSLNTEEENMDKESEKAVKDAKKDLISENVKKDDSLAYIEAGFKVGGEPVKDLKLGLNFRVYNSNSLNLGVKYSKQESPATVSNLDGNDASDILMKYAETSAAIKGATKLGLFAEYTVFGINAKLSNDLESYLGLGLKYSLSENNVSLEDILNVKVQEKPALNLSYTYNYKDMFMLENKFGLSGIFNFVGKFDKSKESEKFEISNDSTVISIDPEVNATVKATDRLSFNAGAKVGFDILMHKVDKPKAEIATDTAPQTNKDLATDFRTEITPSLGMTFKATDKLTLDSTTSVNVNLINKRVLKSTINFGGSLKYEW